MAPSAEVTQTSAKIARKAESPGMVVVKLCPEANRRTERSGTIFYNPTIVLEFDSSATSPWSRCHPFPHMISGCQRHHKVNWQMSNHVKERILVLPLVMLGEQRLFESPWDS